MVTNQVTAELVKSEVFVVEINLDVVSASQQKHSKEKEVLNVACVVKLLSCYRT